MPAGAAPRLAPAAVEAFLAEWHGLPVTDLEPLSGGFWSSAFAYRVESQEYVVRYASDRAGFEADRAAMAFDGPDLPVPALGTYVLLQEKFATSLHDFGFGGKIYIGFAAIIVNLVIVIAGSAVAAMAGRSTEGNLSEADYQPPAEAETYRAAALPPL